MYFLFAKLLNCRGENTDIVSIVQNEYILNIRDVVKSPI